jgi:MFS superfamily sulfate permease-like transporter
LSRTAVAITGPAAGLSAVAVYSISELGSFPLFLLAVVLAGLVQIALGIVRAGSIARFFPVSVVQGMLAGIGLILIFRQLPHAVGYDASAEGVEESLQTRGIETFVELFQAAQGITPGALVIAGVSLVVLIFCSGQYWKSRTWTRLLPGALMAVLVSVLTNKLLLDRIPALALSADHRVSIPKLEHWSVLPWQLNQGEFAGNVTLTLGLVVVTLALVASLESLLNTEAVDKLDPMRRITPLNKELIAQGVTNVASGLLGGLPVTVVIVRSSLNINAGARSRLATVVQGTFLAVAVLAFPASLELIPLSCLAVILIVTGYKLSSAGKWRRIYLQGANQFIPFAVTAVTIFTVNLLAGLLVGLLVALLYVVKSNFSSAILTVNREGNHLIRFTKGVSFLNKARFYKILEDIPDHAHVVIDGTRADFIDHDIIETLNDFQQSAVTRYITVEIVRKPNASHPFFKGVSA